MPKTSMNADPITIAIVDDFIPLRRFLKNYLSTQGFDVACESSNGQEFLHELDRHDELPEVCLLNINMPVMNGYETAKQLKELYPSIQILAFSFLNDKKRIEKILSCGAHGFISKDASPEELRDALAGLSRESLRLMTNTIRN